MANLSLASVRPVRYQEETGLFVAGLCEAGLGFMGTGLTEASYQEDCNPPGRRLG